MEEAIAYFCEFAEGKPTPEDPKNDQELFNMLNNIKKCPCQKEQCMDRMTSLLVKDKLRQQLKHITDTILDQIYA